MVKEPEINPIDLDPDVEPEQPLEVPEGQALDIDNDHDLILHGRTQEVMEDKYDIKAERKEYKEPDKAEVDKLKEESRFKASQMEDMAVQDYDAQDIADAAMLADIEDELEGGQEQNKEAKSWWRKILGF